jgi:queuine tRNA-ribosyltransferase
MSQHTAGNMSPTTGAISQSELRLAHGTLRLPAYLPDATHGFVKGGLDSADLKAAGIEALMMNAFCLMEKPGINAIRAIGGLHKMMGWDGPIFTDSGGFQTYSIIRQNSKFGTVTDGEIIFRPDGKGDKVILNAEKVIQKQFAFGSDVMFCLDECTHATDDYSMQQRSVARTVSWAQRSKAEYDRLILEKEVAPGKRPLIFAVVQGGSSLELRRECVEKLLEIGFDGYGFGGWPLDQNKQLLVDVLSYVRQMLPTQFPLHALGIGHPDSLVRCADLQYGIFDCSMPTKDARNGRLYIRNAEQATPESIRQEGWFNFVYIDKDGYRTQDSPLSPNCRGACCTQYSAGALHYFHTSRSPLFERLATIHNLRFMADLAAALQQGWTEDREPIGLSDLHGPAFDNLG